MKLQNPPEIADGGYWYVVPITSDPDLGGQTIGAILGNGWCAWYGNTSAAVRTPEPVVGVDSEGGAESILSETGYTTKPRGRVGGS